MEVPDLVAANLEDEDLLAGVNLGDEDTVCLTPTRTLVYRSEGILSDESLTVLPHDVERLALSEGRRKTTFRLIYVDREETFSVPGNRVDRVLELLLEGILGAADVTEDGESVRGVYRFSELTLILTDRRLVKHVGAYLWDEDYEEYPYADVTGLTFEEGSVATQIVLSVGGRPHRIKAPNDAAPTLKRTLQEALFSYHDVDSVAELNETLGGEPPAEEAEQSGTLTFDSDIDPLVGHSDDAADRSPDTPESDETTESRPVSQDSPATAARSQPPAASDDLETAADVADRLEALTGVIKRQNELLRTQQDALEELLEELRDGT